MTEQQRLEQFLAAYDVLVKQFGVTHVAVPQIRQYGDMIQIDKPVLQLALVEDWQPPQADDTVAPLFEQPKPVKVKESANGG